MHQTVMLKTAVKCCDASTADRDGFRPRVHHILKPFTIQFEVSQAFVFEGVFETASHRRFNTCHARVYHCFFFPARQLQTFLTTQCLISVGTRRVTTAENRNRFLKRWEGKE